MRDGRSLYLVVAGAGLLAFGAIATMGALDWYAQARLDHDMERARQEQAAAAAEYQKHLEEDQ